MEENNNSTVSLKLTHHGQGGQLFVIMLVNLALTILTLGIYKFWGKTRIRRYLWSQTSINDERLEYTGTGKELFFGFLIAMLFFIVIGFLYAFLAPILEAQQPMLFGFTVVLLALSFYWFVGVAIYSARRYKLSRSQWRGIRFGQSGSAFEYGMFFLGYLLITILTLGLYAPFMRIHMAHYSLNNTWFGGECLRFNGRGRDMFIPFLIAIPLTILTLGIYWAWYVAKEARYIAEHTTIQNQKFSSGYTGGQWFGLMFINILLIIFTLGLAFPWAITRTVNFFCEHYSLQGAIDLQAIEQSKQEAPTTGEGLVEALDLGGI